MSGAVAKPKIAAIVGSNRRDSLNRKLARALIGLGAGRFDAVFLRIDDLPLYNQDHETPLPAAVTRFKNALSAADGFDLLIDGSYVVA